RPGGRGVVPDVPGHHPAPGRPAQPVRPQARGRGAIGMTVEHMAPAAPGPGPAVGPRTAPAGARQPIIAARGITKYFGTVVALRDVDIEVHAGEIVCLLGDNGAGKSTLIKILSGVHPPDAGELL